MVDLAGGWGSERVAVEVDERACEEEATGKVIEKGMRTGTEGTLVGGDDDDDDDDDEGGKGLEDGEYK